uniref:CX domain-containing protein n=1 Tax=Steinernema glaseri TaxID=37863 RepID=A0A1I8AQP6_9BILA
MIQLHLFHCLLLLLPASQALDAYCYRQLYLDTPHPLPLKCPPEDWFTYYDCCEGYDHCCPYLKWPNLVFLILIILGLLLGCCCCCFFLIAESCKRRKRNNEKVEAITEQNRSEVQQERPEEPFQHTAYYHNFDIIGTEV